MSTHEDETKTRATMTERLQKTFPTVYGTCRFDHDVGWESILVALGKKLADRGVSIGYVKEKYATLNFNVSAPEPPYGPRWVEPLLKAATDRSARTCELCGKPGRWVSNENMWEMIRCKECYGEHEDALGRDDPDALDDYEPSAEALADAREAGCGPDDDALSEAGGPVDDVGQIEEPRAPLTLDQAIEHHEGAAGKCDDWCGAEHEQVATWLRELRDRQGADDSVRSLLQTAAEHVARLEGELRVAKGLPACGESCCRLSIEDDLTRALDTVGQLRAEVERLRGLQPTASECLVCRNALRGLVWTETLEGKPTGLARHVLCPEQTCKCGKSFTPNGDHLPGSAIYCSARCAWA